MIILTHIIIALASIGIASFTFFKPTVKKLAVSYGFIVATVVTGTYLLVTTPSHLLESCVMGLFYVTAISVATIAAHLKLRKLAVVTQD